MSRQIVLDTETTGLSPKDGHRIIEIGCIELINRRITDNHYHVYLNPDREVDAGAVRVHGITNEKLIGKPRFIEVVDDFLSYLDGSELIIHNAPFDVGFINHELKLCQQKLGTIEKQCKITDTLKMAREKHMGQKNTLDALCKRYDINNQHRTLHGALLDSQLLAQVYLAMTGGQDGLFQAEEGTSGAGIVTHAEQAIQIHDDLPVIHATEEEVERHRTFMESISE